MDSTTSSSLPIASRDAKAVVGTISDFAPSVTAGFAKEATLRFQVGKFADCLKVLNELLRLKRERSKVPGGKNRDRKNKLLVVRDNGNSFKIIPSGERDDPTTVIEKEEQNKTRQDMEKHLRKLRDFSV
ncbi:unnamed protein product [Fraxinus pennsylvanica]|uniref:Uncharacterized protein n=1 Tax=Fraxinus pennsylvanica TaxID=56036 RepID=A0AAD2AK77_9LAMI|nr:unnamed protein product [Fraxinus pennsylvanica]